VISVLCPTRGRPDSMRRMAESARETAVGEVEILFYVDEDDRRSRRTAERLGAGVVTGERIVLSQMWNVLAEKASGDIVMQCGDDVVFRTPGWDVRVEEVFARYPDRVVFVYGDDLYWSTFHGTHGFVHKRWIEAVGYFLPPHFSCDWSDVWLNQVAAAVGRIVYLPDVITEHMHPTVGKAVLDRTHQERLERGRRDDVASLYQRLKHERAADAAKLRAVMLPEFAHDTQEV
jgi:hypothetical protein